jgi:hypothetical protein
MLFNQGQPGEVLPSERIQIALWLRDGHSSYIQGLGIGYHEQDKQNGKHSDGLTSFGCLCK